MIIFLVPIVGMGMLACAESVKNRATKQVRLVFRLRLTAAVCLLLGLLAIVAIGIVVLKRPAGVRSDLSGMMAIFVALGMVIIMIAVGVLILKLESGLRAESMGEPNAAEGIAQNVYSIYVLGWIFVGLPFLLFVPAAIVLLVFPIFPLVITFLIMSAHKKKRQGHLLWLLAIAVQKGIPLADEVEAHAKAISATSSRRQIHELAELLREGMPLAEALNQLPGLVPRYAIVSASIGAETGKLGQSLRESAARHTESMQLAASASSVVWFGVYVFVVVSAIQSLLAFQMMFIVPKLKAIFRGFNTELPPITQLLIDLSDEVTNEFLLFVPFIAMPTLVMLLAGAIYYWGWGNLNIPWIGSLFRRCDSPWLLRNLSKTVSSKLPIPDAMDTMSDFHLRSDSRRRLKRIETATRAGEECWDVLQRERLINGREKVVLKSAQQANNLPWVLNELADNVERKLQYRLLYWFELFKPMLVIAVGLTVLFVCAAFFLPLVTLIGDMS